MKIITREGWGARAPRNARDVVRVSWADRTEFVVHHTAGPKGQRVRAIQDFHITGRGWNDIGYNFLVDAEGAIYEGRGWLVVGAHCPDHNRIGIGVAFIGSNNPTAAAMQSIRGLYDEACRRAGRALRKRGHGQLFSTSCPGPRLQAWVNAGMPLDQEQTPAPEPPLKIVWRSDVPTWPGRALKVAEPMMTGEDIRLWQERLARRGWRIDVDSWYGPKSRTVCRGYQRATGLPDTGIVDRATWDMTWSWRPPAEEPAAAEQSTPTTP
ncbi:peptidoglycan recognition protein family protein [Microtetraspora niveoalba]|uniref:peptidoglycan recognition protein family protein n=1 Tax=Microtetraspora niveoalba TaxID=46175 RepID=UPI0008355C3C|nr:peptidoglycan-binding domain-containing protein [Microtetraspora niveoalba]